VSSPLPAVASLPHRSRPRQARDGPKEGGATRTDWGRPPRGLDQVGWAEGARTERKTRAGWGVSNQPLREPKRSGVSGRWRGAVSPPAMRQAENSSKTAPDSLLTLQPIGGRFLTD